jgi:protein-S-isoprenylcysteine O-methyltransferase Ste14
MDAYLIGPNGVFDTALTAALFTVLQFAFMATESRRSRRAPASATREKMPFPTVIFAILGGLVIRLVCGFGMLGVLRGETRVVWIAVGFALVLVGWGLRVWAQRELGKYFTGEVAVQTDHRVIDTGPYRWVRHPAYTGGILSAIGFGLTLSTWLGAVLSGGLLIWAYALRVPREEALLTRQLGPPYQAYLARTRRFLPGIF